MSRVFHVAIEGPDGVGKSHMVTALSERLRQWGGVEVLTVTEPGSAAWSPLLRGSIPGSKLPKSVYRHLLMMFDKAETYAGLRDVEHPRIIVSDRSILSTLVYQYLLPIRQKGYTPTAREVMRCFQEATTPPPQAPELFARGTGIPDLVIYLHPSADIDDRIQARGVEGAGGDDLQQYEAPDIAVLVRACYEDVAKHWVNGEGRPGFVRLPGWGCEDADLVLDDIVNRVREGSGR